MAPSRLDTNKTARAAIELNVILRCRLRHAQSTLQGARQKGVLQKATMQTRDLITEKLRNAFAPESLRVEDESHRHEGHAGHRPGGETHFRLYIVSEAFRGKSRLERHRMINAALAGELAGGVHALAIHAAAPGETL
jgi:BolA family transcriptional regulator, general stress-responsive regulator